MKTLFFRLFFILGVFAVAVPAVAQTDADPAATARVRLGPLGLTPAIALQNVGIDSNVFNDSQNPQRDFTAVLRPQTQAWLRFGRANLSMDGFLEGLYFRRFASERGINGGGSGTLNLHLNRISVFAGTSLLSTRQRGGLEIDARARYRNDDVFGGANVRLSGRTDVVLRAQTTQIRYASDTAYRGISLGRALDRRVETIAAAVEHSLTPLSTVRLNVEVQRDGFLSSPGRDAESLRVSPGIQFKPTGTLTGGAVVGYRRFRPTDAAVAPFSGVVASVDMGYVLRGFTRFAVTAQRDLQYSFDQAQAYYVVTGVNGSLSQALGNSWGVTVSAGRQQLNYVSLVTSVTRVRGRKEPLAQAGGGVFFRLSPLMQVGVNADYQRRRSIEVADRNYTGLRVGSFLSYGVRGQR